MSRQRSLPLRVAFVGLLGVGLAACAGAGADDSSSTSPSVESTVAQPTTTVEPGTTTTEAPTTTRPSDAVPADLAGSWRTRPDDPTNESVCLSMGANNYSHSICGDPTTLGGTLSFAGDTITFTSSMLGCPEGLGVYRWAFDGQYLSLTQLDPLDECDIRAAQLDGQVFSR